MIHFRIQTIGLFRQPERFTGCYHFNAILFVVSGMKYWRACGYEITQPKPMFILAVKGQPRDGEYGPDRESWVIVLDEIELRPGAQSGFVEIDDGKTQILLPVVTPILSERVPGWQMEFERIKSVLRSPTAQNRFRAEMGVMNIFRHLIDAHAESLQDTPAAHLKRLIDQDTCFQKTLHELSLECQYSPDHLRLLFHNEYGISPYQYHARRRMALAMEFIANSRLSVKEISAKLGFAHTSAFSAMFKKQTKCSPLQAIRQFRNA